MLDTVTLHTIRQTLFSRLNPKKYRVFLYGSRANGKDWKWSDIDIGIEGDEPVSREVLGMIREDFENSNIPYMVDVVDFSTSDPTFVSIAKQHTVALS